MQWRDTILVCEPCNAGRKSISILLLWLSCCIHMRQSPLYKYIWASLWNSVPPLWLDVDSFTMSITQREEYLLNGAWTAQSVVCWVRCPAWCSIADSILLWASSRGDFFLWSLHRFWLHSLKTLLDENINRGLVCAHVHSIAWTQKILTFMSLTGECRQQKHTQHAPSTKMEYDYLHGWIKKPLHMQKSHPKWCTPQI